MKIHTPYSPNEEKVARMISFIVPAMNEEATLKTLYNGIQKEMSQLTDIWEILFIDDGSTDGTWNEMVRIQENNPQHIRIFKFRRNSGKANALALGYSEAKGEIVFTMDADLQDDPKEIPRFIAAIEDGADVVSGWKRKRHDPWHKVLPSRVFNAIISHLSGVKLHDHNCGFKAYRNEVIRDLPMYGDMHRMVPALAAFKGFKSVEIEVEHHARIFGKSKYGWSRIIVGLMDMTTIYFLQRYRERPMHFMGKIALVSGMIACICFLSALVLALTTSLSVVGFVIVGFIFIAMGSIIISQGLIMEYIVYEKMKEIHELHVSQYEKADAKSTVSDFHPPTHQDPIQDI